MSTPMRRTRSLCCARAASGHAAAPPSSDMSERRFTAGPFRAFAPKVSTPQLRQEPAALRDFDPAFVRFGSGADISRLLSHVRFAPQSGHRGFDSKSPLQPKAEA